MRDIKVIIRPDMLNIKVISGVRCVSSYLIKAIYFLCGVNWLIASSTGRIHDGAPEKNLLRSGKKKRSEVRYRLWCAAGRRAVLLSDLQASQLIYGRGLKARRSQVWSRSLMVPSLTVRFRKLHLLRVGNKLQRAKKYRSNSMSVWLYLHNLKRRDLNLDNNNTDICFSSLLNCIYTPRFKV